MRYCCKKFERHLVKNGSIFETPESPEVYGVRLRMRGGDDRHITDWMLYCPFCGKKLKSAGKINP